MWKNRFCILWRIPQYFLEKKRDIVIACAVIHNFIKLFSDEAIVFNSEEDVLDDSNDKDDIGEGSSQQWNDENNDMGHFRDQLAN